MATLAELNKKYKAVLDSMNKKNKKEVVVVDDEYDDGVYEINDPILRVCLGLEYTESDYSDESDDYSDDSDDD